MVSGEITLKFIFSDPPQSVIVSAFGSNDEKRGNGGEGLTFTVRLVSLLQLFPALVYVRVIS
jgi:hypothetical protein